MGVAKGMRAGFYFLFGQRRRCGPRFMGCGAVSFFDLRTEVGQFGSTRKRQTDRTVVLGRARAETTSMLNIGVIIYIDIYRYLYIYLYI
jgi:hypothetical protein